MERKTKLLIIGVALLLLISSIIVFNYLRQEYARNVVKPRIVKVKSLDLYLSDKQLIYYIEIVVEVYCADNERVTLTDLLGYMKLYEGNAMVLYIEFYKSQITLTQGKHVILIEGTKSLSLDEIRTLRSLASRHTLLTGEAHIKLIYRYYGEHKLEDDVAVEPFTSSKIVVYT